MPYVATQQIILQRNHRLAKQITKTLPAFVYTTVATVDGLFIRTSIDNLRSLSTFLRNNTYFQCRSLVDIAVTDKLLPTGRFVVNYLFLSVALNQRLCVQLFTNETSTIPSLAVPFANGQRLFAAAG
jgi:NADH:ubiquinone oxidoreductase subunit C